MSVFEQIPEADRATFFRLAVGHGPDVDRALDRLDALIGSTHYADWSDEMLGTAVFVAALADYERRTQTVDLAERMTRAAAELLAMAVTNVDPARRAHLKSKAEGVKLALSYVEETRS